MQLLDLPLDCFRYMLSFIARDFDYHGHVHEFLRLRLTNRLMDAEVLRTLATPSFFKWEGDVRTLETTVFSDSTRLSYPDPSKRLPLTSSYPEFVASYLYLKPLRQTPWNANFSSFLNYVVDALLSADGLDINDESRKTIIKELCCHVFDRKEWKRRTDRVARIQRAARELALGRRATLAEQDISELMTRESSVFGTLLQTCIKSGQVELVASLLDSGIDVNDQSLKTLETAIECENPDMLRLLFSPKYNLSDSVGEPTRFTMAMSQAVQMDRTEAALYLISICALSDAPDDSDNSQDNASCIWYTDRDFAAYWIGEAASRNNFAIVKNIMEGLDREHPLGEELVKSDRILRLVIFYGHKDMLRFLLNWGIKCDHGSMMLAVVCSGDISMVRFLLRECGVVLKVQTWHILLYVAVQHGTPRHQAFIEAVFTDPNMFEGQTMSVEILFEDLKSCGYDLFRYACGYGNVFVVRKIAEAGVQLDHFGGHFVDTPPMLVALLAGQTAVVDALIEMGAKPIDPMKTEFKGGFLEGRYPKVWRKRTVSVWSCDRWMVWGRTWPDP